MKKHSGRRKADSGAQGELFGATPGPTPKGPDETPPTEAPEVKSEAQRQRAGPEEQGGGVAEEAPREGGAHEEEDVARGRPWSAVGGRPVPVAPTRTGAALLPGEELFLPGRNARASGIEPPGEPAMREGRSILTVGELTRSIKGTLEGAFPHVLVKGEVSGFRGVHQRGHLFFALKDAEASIEVKVWASAASRLKFTLRDGMSLIVEGSVDVYAPQGRYSLVAQRLEPAGEGALALAFQQLKERLAAEGLFGPLRTRPPRPLPFPPRRIGVVTSRSGAALQDFLRVLHARHPRLSVLVCDARVQGEGAADDVVQALKRLARTDVDVIVVTRGGGSVEDLWTFNEERVARAIFASPVPVVSAIGHEVDFTIADFVADVRAPTPSAAAELLAPVLVELQAGLSASAVRLRKAAEHAVLEAREELARLRLRLPDPHRLVSQGRLHLHALTERMVRAGQGPLRAARERQRRLLERLDRQRPQAKVVQSRAAVVRLRERLLRAQGERLRSELQRVGKARVALERSSPLGRVRVERARLSALESQVEERLSRRLEGERARLSALAGRLEAMSPLKVMARGYSVTFRRADGAVVRSASDVRVGEDVIIRLAGVDCREPSDCEELEARVLE
ncbi:MAG: exodeoxyribonuclease VII large subunit, partial [Myxococcaceae bacterium]|nr:exodeoxyribonuclease VII large subunit [Myxococcaceae bacterium]